jgi:hypothetical protein
MTLDDLMPVVKEALGRMEPEAFAKFYNYHFAGENRMIRPSTEGGWEEIPGSGGDEAGGRFVKALEKLMRSGKRLALRPNAYGEKLITVVDRNDTL